MDQTDTFNQNDTQLTKGKMSILAKFLVITSIIFGSMLLLIPSIEGKRNVAYIYILVIMGGSEYIKSQY